MATSKRFFQDGINEVNGFVVNVIRFVGAYNTSFNESTGRWNRQCALHWGTITTPDGEEISMGDSGMSTPQIKRIIGSQTKSYNRGGKSCELKQLESLKSQLESLGLDTSEVDAKIEAKKAEIEEANNRVDNSKEIKRIEKEIKKLDKAKQQLESLGLSTTEVTWKIADLQAQIENLM